MAIGFNLPGIPGQIRGTAEEAGAVPDLGQAMMQGFRSNLENVQGYPRQLAQQLLSNQLANTINRAKAKYAEPMAKTAYDQALANLQHQGLINQYYGKMQESALRGQGLSQAHQQMINQQLGYNLERQKYYQDLWRQAIQSGYTEDQAHQVASQGTAQAFGGGQQPQAGIAMPQQLPEEPYGYTPMPMEPARGLSVEGAEGFTPMTDTGIGLGYTPITQRKGKGQKGLRERLAEALLQQQAGSISDFIAPETQNLLFGQSGQIGREPTLAQSYQGMSPFKLPEQAYQQQLLTQAAEGFTPAAQNLFEPGRTQELQQMGYPLNQVMPEQAPIEQQAPQAAPEAQQPQSYEEQLRNAGYDTTAMQPGLSKMDEAYLRNPGIRNLLKQDFPNIGVKQFNDFPRNRIITTETLPSGATRTQMHQLPGTLPGQETKGGKLTQAALLTPLGRALARRNYVDTYGENSNEVKEFDKKAKEMDKNEALARELKQQQLEQGKEKIELQKEANQFRRQALEVQKRKGLGKVGMAFADLMDAKGGFIPGTDKKFLSPEDQQNAIKTIQASINKIATDPKQREMLVASKQIDNTIKNLDVDALVQYSGIYGEAFKKGEKIKSGLGLTSPEYKRYSEAAKLAEFLAKQVRKFYGESIQKYSTEAINALTNPSQWAASPDVAKQNYQTFVKNLLQETDIAKDFFIYADSFDKGQKLTTARTQAVDDELKKIEEEMKKRGMKVGG